MTNFLSGSGETQSGLELGQEEAAQEQSSLSGTKKGLPAGTVTGYKQTINSGMPQPHIAPGTDVTGTGTEWREDEHPATQRS